VSTPALEVRGLNVALGGIDILRDVNLVVEPGHYVSIIGPNGAGKSTLLKCFNRIVRASSGDLRIDGTPIAALSQRDLARRVGYVPQADARYLPFRVEEFVLMGRYPHLSPFSSIRPADRDAARDALHRTGTLRFAERSLDTLSGGERQAVFIAAALAQGARILLLDEPTTFLDYRHRVEVHALLDNLHATHPVTIISVTHDVNDAVLTSEKVIALKQGRVVFDGTPAKLIADETLEALYDTPFERIVSDRGETIVRPSGGA